MPIFSALFFLILPETTLVKFFSDFMFPDLIKGILLEEMEKRKDEIRKKDCVVGKGVLWGSGYC